MTIKPLTKKNDDKKVKFSFSNTLFTVFKFIIIPLVILLVAIRIFAVRTYQRELFYSEEAYIARNEITVGSEGYGTVSSIFVDAGDRVNKGDVLYKYSNSELDEKIYLLEQSSIDVLLDEAEEDNVSLNSFNQNVDFEVKAQSDGIVKSINITAGDYVTKEEETLTLESTETFVRATIKVPEGLVARIKPRMKVFVRLSPEVVVEGYIKTVYPEYDAGRNTIEVDAVINDDELSRIDFATIYTGSPVTVTVFSPDSFTESFKNNVANIDNNFIQKYLSYEI